MKRQIYRERKRKQNKIVPSGSLPKWPPLSGLDQAKSKSLDLLPALSLGDKDTRTSTVFPCWKDTEEPGQKPLCIPDANSAGYSLNHRVTTPPF